MNPAKLGFMFSLWAAVSTGRMSRSFFIIKFIIKLRTQKKMMFVLVSEFRFMPQQIVAIKKVEILHTSDFYSICTSTV